MIDSSWKLIDVTWASGFVNFSDDYVPYKDDNYFFASPLVLFPIITLKTRNGHC